MGESTDNNWLSSWISAAKMKSTEVLEFVKKDLEEFGNAVRSEANTVVCTTGSVLENTLGLNEPESAASSMKRSFSSFLGQMHNVLKQGPDDSDTEAILITEGCDNVTLTKLQKIIYELQQNEKTFLEDPDPSLDQQYQCWLDIIDEQLTEDRLSKHLINSLTLHNQYLKLVPDSVSHQLFWKRYLFKKALVEDELAREEDLEKKQLKEKASTDEFKWDQEEFSTNIELSEEEQIRLLQEYEEETKLKTKQKSPEKGENATSTNSTSKSTTNKCDTPISTKTEKVLETNEKGYAKSDKNISAADETVNKTTSTASLDIETKSSNSSSDGDWEKINDVDK